MIALAAAFGIFLFVAGVVLIAMGQTGSDADERKLTIFGSAALGVAIFIGVMLSWSPHS